MKRSELSKHKLATRRDTRISTNCVQLAVMLRLRAIILPLCFLALPSCAVIEEILVGLSRFVDENDDGPKFAYATHLTDPRVRIAAVTPDDKGLVLADFEFSEGTEITTVALSPNLAFVAGDWNFIFADVGDFGVYAIDASSDRVVFETDNTISLAEELACRLPDFEAEAKLLAIDYIRVLEPGSMPSADEIDVDIMISDVPSNTLTFVGWTDPIQFTVRYEYESNFTFQIDDPPVSGPYDGAPRLMLRGDAAIRRAPSGIWIFDACATPAPVEPPRSPVRDLAISPAGEILLDGIEIIAALGGSPMEQRTVTRIDGPY
ncbi:MAG: hypothetical protein ACR2OY_10325 [Boseongicola sp.]